MPWRVESMKSQKQKFILLYETGHFTKTELCKEFGISRPTGDAIIKRYHEEGWNALEERSRQHKDHPFKTPERIENEIIRIRTRYKNWGARKIRYLLLKEYDEEEIPSETTVNGIMKKNGLTKKRRTGRRQITPQYPRFDPKEPNEIWSGDFKGKFRMKNGVYCYPLTVVDSYSRYILGIEGVERADTENSKPILEKIFREYGVPEYFHTDNGAPFGNAGSLRRLTMLAVWEIEVGTTPVYSDPASPQQNGRHERMHRDLKAEATRPPGNDLRSQQYLFNQFVEDYNTIRPHEALGMKTPAEVHKRSVRQYPGIIRDWYYDKDLDVRMVTVNGAFRWKDKGFVMVSTALAGKYVGLDDLGNGFMILYFRHVPLGYFCERMMKVYDLEDYNF